MRQGLWHQLGDRGQKLALEQFEQSNGAGAIFSPRDLSRDLVVSYSEKYRNLGAEVLFDPQFYNPSQQQGKIATYEDFLDFRVSESRLAKHSRSEFKKLGTALRSAARDFQCTGVMAPAVAMHAGQPEALQLNLDLLQTAKDAADAIGLPLYAVVPVGDSLALSEKELSDVLSALTAIEVDAWVLMMDTGADGLCRSADHIMSLCKSVLRLAQTGQPVLHGCAGPNSLISLAAGATSIGMAHSKNMWRLPLSRFEPSEGGGGGGATPPRVFSSALWSTFVVPDELVQMPRELRAKVLEHSPWQSLQPDTDEYFRTDMSQWDANKHLLFVVGNTISEILNLPSIASRQGFVIDLLERASLLHDEIARFYSVKDFANEHHTIWVSTLQKFFKENKSDIDYLGMLMDQ